MKSTGHLWTATAQPIRDQGNYVARHGHGYSRFEHQAHGIALDLLQYVPLADPIKISRLTLRNVSGRPRRLSVTGYAEWVLGASRSACAAFIVHGEGRGDRGAAGLQFLERGLPRACRVRRPGRRAADVHGRPHRVPRPQRRTRGTGSAGRPSGVVGSDRRRPRPLRRAAARGGAGARRERRSRVLPRPVRVGAAGARACHTLPAYRPRCRSGGGDSSIGARCSARCR